MRYRCVHCDLRFETTDEKPRCPRCLRRSGVEAESSRAGGRDVRRPASPLWLFAGLAAALAELAAFLRGALDPPEGIAGVAAMVGWLAWAVAATVMVIAGLRGVLARMR